MRQPRYFAARGISMDDALLRRAHDQWLGFFEGRQRLSAIASRNGLFDSPDVAAHFRAARFIDFSAARNLACSFAGGIGICHSVLVSTATQAVAAVGVLRRL